MSTTFQTWLIANRASLAKVGIWYSTAGREATYQAREFSTYAASHSSFAAAVNGSDLDVAVAHLREAMTEAYIAGCPYLLMSHESLIDSPEILAQCLSEVCSRDIPHTLVLLRRSTLLSIRSIWRELLLDGLLENLSESAESISTLPAVRVDHFVRRFIDATSEDSQSRIVVGSLNDCVSPSVLAREILSKVAKVFPETVTDNHVFENRSTDSVHPDLLLQLNHLGSQIFGERKGPNNWIALNRDSPLHKLTFVEGEDWGIALRRWQSRGFGVAQGIQGGDSRRSLDVELTDALMELDTRITGNLLDMPQVEFRMLGET